MKKVYLVLSAIVLGTCAFGQQGVAKAEINPLLPFAGKLKVKENAVINQQKIGGVVVWSDDFSTPSNWVIDNDGQTASTFGWDIGSTEQSWAFNSVIASTSGGNFAELNNGNAQSGTQALNVTYTLTTAGPIDVMGLGGTDYVTLNYQQYGARFNDAQEVYVSTDSVAWQLVDDNSDKPVLSGGGGSAYANPTQEVINIQPYITANPDSVWIRFSWTTAYPASASNPNVWITYGWMIDDVEIVTSPDNDLELLSVMHGSTGFWGAMLPYYQIPTSQVTAIDFMGVVNNKGAVAQSGTQISVNVNSGAFTATSATGFTLSTGLTDSLYATTSFTPGATAATFSYEIEAMSDNTDEEPSNNILTDGFDVTDYVYARDNGVSDGGTFNSGEAYEVGNIFDMFASETIYSINVTINNSSEGAPLIYGKLYSIDATTGDFIFMEQSDDYLVTSADITGQAEVVLPLFSPQTLNANESYLVVVGTYGDGGATNDLVTSTAGEAEAQTVFYFDGTDQTWYYTTSTPMVRMNFEPVPPTVSFSNSSMTVSEGSTASVVLNISEAPTADVTVDLSVTGGTATSGSDYTFTSPTTVTFPAGSSSSQTVSIPITFDDQGESDETILLGLSNVSSNGAVAPGTSTVTISANVSVEENNGNISVGQNYPNPFNGNTTINYSLVNADNVTVEITDLTGKVIAVMNEGVKTAGNHTVEINSNGLAAGTYYYSIVTSNGKVTKAMNIAK